MCEVNEYVNYQTGEKLDLEKVSKLKDNAMLKVRPDLWCEWDFKKNDELGFDIWKVTKGSNKKVWWLGKCGHHWDASIFHRVNGSQCPYCAPCNPKLLVGFNDMWTTNPELASLLLNKEDGYKYMQSSHKKVDWKCPDCNNRIKNKIITIVNKRGLTCPKCSDGFKYPEKLMYNFLNQLDVEFITQKCFDWSDRKRYDFYIPSLNMIIETHGMQHYVDSTGNWTRNLENERSNDLYKYDIAIANGIKPENYIVIDCRYSDFDFIKNNILNSRLAEMFDLNTVDWGVIKELTVKSIVKSVCDLWNNEFKNVELICKKLKLSGVTVRKYLKMGTDIELCYYDPQKEQTEALNRIKEKKSKCVLQLTVDGALVKKWESIAEASRGLGVNHGNLSLCCNGKIKTSGGYKWMFEF